MTERPHRLTKPEAHALVVKIRQSAADLDDLIIEAHHGQAHLALGYPSFAAFAKSEIPHIKRSPEARKAAVQAMGKIPMSAANTAAALGVDEATVRRDRAKSSSLPANAGSDEPQPKPATTRVQARAARPVDGAKIKARVEQYETLSAEHPDWQSKQLAGCMKISSPEVSRLKTYSRALPEIKDALFAGEITGLVVEILTSGKSGGYEGVRDVDRVNMMHKVIAGLCPSGAKQLREAMDMVAHKLSFDLRERWLDPELGMSWHELELAIYDGDAAKAAEAREDARKADEWHKRTYDFDRALRADKILGWLPQEISNLQLTIRQMDELLASERYRGKGGSIPDKLAELADVAREAADLAAARYQLSEDRRNGVEPIVRPNLRVVPPIVEPDGVTGTVLSPPTDWVDVHSPAVIATRMLDQMDAERLKPEWVLIELLDQAYGRGVDIDCVTAMLIARHAKASSASA